MGCSGCEERKRLRREALERQAAEKQARQEALREKRETLRQQPQK